jgi:hypothetical protein
METWKPVPTFEGRYSVSDAGRVRSEARHCLMPRGRGARAVTEKILATARDRDGYAWVMLTEPGRRCQFKVATLVALTFIGPRPEGMQMCHNDGSRDNDTATNLRYDTQAGNMRDRIWHGTAPRGERNNMAKLSSAQVDAIRADRRPAALVAADHATSRSNVYMIRSGKTWQ